MRRPYFFYFIFGVESVETQKKNESSLRGEQEGKKSEGGGLRYLTTTLCPD